MFQEGIKNIAKLLQKRKEFFLLVGIIALGLILRLINIGVEPYWADELLSLGTAKHYLGDPVGLWNYLEIAEVHPPLYYYLIQGWGSLFGFGEAGIKSLSLIFSLGLIALTYWAGLVLFKSKKIGLMAAFISAILPMQIEFGQEARPYALYSFFGILSLILLAKYFETTKTKKKLGLIIGFAFASIIGLYLHYSYSLILIPLSLYWLIWLIIKKSGREFIWWLATMAVIFVGFWPWLPALIFKTFLIKDIHGELNRSAVVMTRQFDFLESGFGDLLWANKEKSHAVEITAAFMTKLMLGVLMVLLIKNSSLWLKKNKKSIIYLVFVLLLSMLLFLFMPNSVDYTTLIFKHIIFDSSILALLIGAIFVLTKNIRWRLICLSLFIISLMTFQIKIISDDSLYDFNYRFKIVVDHINERYQKGDLLLTYIVQIRPQLNYYLKDGIPGFVGVFPSDMLIPDFMETRDTLGFMENESQFRFTLAERPSMAKKFDYLIKKGSPKRVWIVGEGATGQMRRWFTSNGWTVGSEPVGNLFPLTLYVKDQEQCLNYIPIKK